MIDLSQIKEKIQRGEDIEKIVEEIDWKEFEELVIEVLERHDFLSCHNFRFKMDKLYEIDVVATKNNFVLGIDCKMWNKGRYKKTGLKYAVKSQKERMKKFQKMLVKDEIIKDILNLKKKPKIVPLIVTWFEEDLIEHEKVFIVPIWKFNQFLLTMSEYI